MAKLGVTLPTLAVIVSISHSYPMGVEIRLNC